MNIDKDIRDELIELMKKSINHYNSFKHYKPLENEYSFNTSHRSGR